MPLYRVVLRELFHYRWNSLAGLLAVMLAVGAIAGTALLLGTYDARAAANLEAKQAELETRLAVLHEDIRSAMGQLGFNLVILPEGEDLADWYAEDQGKATMPESYVTKLATAGAVSIQHPVAQLRRRVIWPETKWAVLIVGKSTSPLPLAGEGPGVRVVSATRTFEDTNLNSQAFTPPAEMAARHVETPKPDTVALGHELHKVLGYREGDVITLMGREFRVARCLPREGNKDDITIWMALADAQQLLDQPGRISEIVALGCAAAPEDFARVRQEIAQALPGTQVIEKTPEVLATAMATMQTAEKEQAMLQQERVAQAELSRDRQRLAGLVDVLVVASCGLWIGWLAWNNAAERRAEIGLWRACGVQAARLVLIFFGRWFALGIIGTAAGVIAAAILGRMSGAISGFEPEPWIAAVGVAVGLSVLASGVAAWIASREDPATTLRALH